MITHFPTRRRALAIIAGTAGALALSEPSQAWRHEWRGTALGADARILLAGYGEGDARRIIAAILAEVARLEAAFSLYRPDSEISRLNRDGVLAAPSHDMRILLDQAVAYWRRTGGAFNPAVQPLWRHLAAHFASRPGEEPDAVEIGRLVALCDPTLIERAGGAIRLAPGMAITFNGIAQGYITDRAAERLRNEGARDILLGLGEFRALAGRPWQVEIAGTGRVAPLADRAVATSAGAGTPFTADLRWHHLVDPISGRSPGRFRTVTVIADRAAEADALSTALAASHVLEPSLLPLTFPGVEVLAVDAEGSHIAAPARPQARQSA